MSILFPFLYIRVMVDVDQSVGMIYSVRMLLKIFVKIGTNALMPVLALRLICCPVRLFYHFSAFLLRLPLRM